MKNIFIITASILLLCLSLPACKFNFGTNGTTSNSGSSKANRRTAKTENSANKSVSSKDDETEIASEDSVDEDAPDPESDTSQTTDFRIKRSYYALDENRPKDLLTLDGDYMYFKELESGGTAGFFYSTKPQEAIYALWGGEIIAGPLTTEQQVEEVAAMLSKKSKAEHEMRMSIINNRPTGILGPVRVYDQNGNLIREQ